jgi:hypothetical protein
VNQNDPWATLLATKPGRPFPVPPGPRAARRPATPGSAFRRRHEPRRVFRVTRATVGLVIIALALGLALASTIGLIVWAIASALHHASSA